MKGDYIKKTITGLVTGLLLIGLLGCASGPEPSSRQMARAQELSLENESTGRFGWSGGEDWFRIQVPDSGNLIVRDFSNSNPGIGIEAYDTDGQLIARIQGGFNRINNRLEIPVEAGNIYFFRIFHEDVSTVRYNIRAVLVTTAELDAIAAAEEDRRIEARRRFWAIRNPDNFDRSEYRNMSVSDFSFNMVAGNLPVDAKVRFTTRFLNRPTGINYLFEGVNPLLTLTSRHNFVQNILNDEHEIFFFGQPTGMRQRITDITLIQVAVYATVTRTGQTGAATIDIITWGREP